MAQFFQAVRANRTDNPETSSLRQKKGYITPASKLQREIFHIEQDLPQWAFGAKMTSYQRWCDVMTAHQRWYDVILAPNAHWDTNNGSIK